MTPTAALLEEIRLLRQMGDGGRAAATKALRSARLASPEVDPMKYLTHSLDSAIVDRGGGSIFSAKARGPLSAEAEARLEAWALGTPRIHPGTTGVKPKDRPNIAKPGRIVGTLTGKLGGFASDRDGEG